MAGCGGCPIWVVDGGGAKEGGVDGGLGGPGSFGRGQLPFGGF